MEENIEQEKKVEQEVVEKEAVEQQRYKFMDCPICNMERRFISTLSPKGSWVCCCCGYKTSGKKY